MTTLRSWQPALALASWLWCATAWASVLTVTVTGADGKPAADTVVMLKRPGAFQAFDVRATPVIVQKDIRFEPYVTVVQPRGMVRFVNQDRFDHHVRSMPTGPLGSVKPAQEFEFRLGAAKGGKAPQAELSLQTTGAIVLGCHLHGSMRAHIFVTPTPWYAVTDAQGRATLDVPDGAGELALWHPDQLADQPVRALTVAGDGAVQQVLNFAPRKRATRPPAGEYRY